MNQRSSNQENYEEACSPANITEPTKEHQKYKKMINIRIYKLFVENEKSQDRDTSANCTV